MSVYPDSVAGQGEFHDSIKPSKPLTHKGHQIGQPVGHEAIPEFHARTYPPGSAPKEHTFYPNPQSEVPGQALNDNMDPSLRTGALDIPGATSQSVYDTSPFSRPMQGESSSEMRSNITGRSGLEGVGASTSDRTVEGMVRQKGADLPEGIERGVRSKVEKSEGGYEAQQRTPASAGEVASERP
ncbi:hypothetical protein B0T16DRAFT_318336 [Cercophora newfieldiana]|uniref:Uncharacterized protein n=1 Tax=Cercophora newfieldiana TaxID=92897 RepID=A0AA39YRR4_9PEZI|nr:hypothetical protein B0T16DRAFT_318336 [Cercophora newfieldiana]